MKIQTEAEMFCAYSKNSKAIKRLVVRLKQACEDASVIRDILFPLELD
jgi:hypothetical protein